MLQCPFVFAAVVGSVAAGEESLQPSIFNSAGGFLLACDGFLGEC